MRCGESWQLRRASSNPGKYRRAAFALVIVAFVVSATLLPLVAAQDSKAESSSPKTQAPKTQAKRTGDERPADRVAFSPADAAHLLDAFAQALESSNQRRFLKLFDPSRMPGYAVFRDQVTECFDRYEGFRVRYHITEVSMEKEVGVILTDFELEATFSRAELPNVRKNAQLRLVTAWDGKQWKIIDLAPRGILR